VECFEVGGACFGIGNEVGGVMRRGEGGVCFF